MYVIKRQLGSVKMLEDLIQEYKSSLQDIHTSPKELGKMINRMSRIAKGAHGEMKVHKELVRLGKQQLLWGGIIHHDDRFKSGAIQIDHILIYGRTLFVIETKHWSEKRTKENLWDAITKTKERGNYIYNLLKIPFPDIKTKEIVVTTNHKIDLHSGKIEKQYGENVEVCSLERLWKVIQIHENYWEERWVLPLSKTQMIQMSKILLQNGASSL